MHKYSCVITLGLLLLTCWVATAQKLPCPASASGKLICTIPEEWGAGGLVLAGSSHQGHFETSFINASATPLNSAIGIQSSILPLTSPSSGITVSWDKDAGVFVSSTDSFGPVLGERAETIGRHRLFIGSSYQYFKFDALDGLSLRKGLPIVLTHQDDFVDLVPPDAAACSVNAPDGNTSDTGNCGYVRDVIRTNTSIDLKIHQFNTLLTFGLTDRIDLSVVIPFENVRMVTNATALIVNNSGMKLHKFSVNGCPDPCFNTSFSQFHTASGIGDLTLRVKGTLWKGERTTVAIGTDVRLPTGDELNFLGSGAIGVRPFAVWSYRSRISPHALLGYEMNSSSLLAGDITNGTKARLPSQVTYSGGADVWLTKKLTLAFDLLGQQVNGGKRLVVSTFTELPACLPVNSGDPCVPQNGATGGGFVPPNTDQNLSPLERHYNITNVSVGAKIKPFGKLLITGNVTFKLNDGGLRAKAVPLVAVSYTF